MTNAANISWLSCYKPNPAATVRLFCFPYAGGSALIYRDWARNFPEWIEVCPVQLPGRGARLREKPFVRMDQLVKSLLREMRPYLTTPFAFFGHSMGAVIGFEITRLLRRENAKLPVHLFISGRGAAQLTPPKPPTYNLPDAEFKQELQRLAGTPAEVLAHPELMEVVMPLLRADFELIQTYNYTYEPPLNIPLTALGGLDDDITREQLEGWRDETTGPFSLRMFAGDHFYLTTNQQLLPPLLTKELAACGLGSEKPYSLVH
jgi:medium-chain acyl-[acyl-carrier-protein] hydrolase